MKVLKIIGCVFLALIIFASCLTLFRRCGTEDKDTTNNPIVETPSTDEEPTDEPEAKQTLNARLENAIYKYVVVVTGENDLMISEDGHTNLGKEGAEITVDGGLNGATITAKGNGKGPISSINGTLTFKNITFKDETPYDGGYFKDYLSFGGELNFEDCSFEYPISLRADAVATFKGCKFKSPLSRHYSVWVSEGSASFEGCTFKGYRGLKIHEFTGADVKTVTVNNCIFDNLSEKVGVVIGSFSVAPSTVSIKNSTFENCQPWDKDGSIEGVNGFYETDMYTSEFSFVTENNTVNYVPHTFKIEYVSVISGEVVEVYPTLFKKNGNYPTEYIEGERVEISQLHDIVWVGEYHDRTFHGWYLDKACTQAFDGVIDTEGDWNITLYAKVSIGTWTPNY